MNSPKSIEDIPMKDLRDGVLISLILSKISSDMIRGVASALWDERVLMAMFIVWTEETNPTEEQIMHWIVEHT